MTLTYISSHLNTHAKCIQYLEKKRWNGIPICPYCQSKKCSAKHLRYTCLGCSNSFSVTVGTFMENTNLPLFKWFMAITLMLSAKKGLSAMQLSRNISVNKNTAWLLQMKIRAAMSEGKLEPFKQKTAFKKKKHSDQTLVKEHKEYGGHFRKNQTFGYWSLLKRAIIGQYHKIEPHYVFRYIDEINFKSNRKHLKDQGYQDMIDRLVFLGVAK